jgi:effector-binding domain-containing protein
MNDIAVIMTAVVGVVGVVAQFIKQRKAIKKMEALLVQHYAQNYLQSPDLMKDDFLKFVSDSREWAFSYIESIQGGLKTFCQEVDDTIAHYDKVGKLITSPHSASMDKISLAYKDLAKFLPEQGTK